MKDNKEKGVTRRKFFETASKGALGSLVLSNFYPSKIPDLFADEDKSRIVRVHHDQATDGTGGKDNVHLDDSVIRQMVDAGVKAFTGESSVDSAWAVIIPDPTKKVAIKVNCQITGIYTKSKIVNRIVEGLVARGVPDDNIIIYDRTDNAFEFAGFVKNTGTGTKIGTVSELGGWSATQGLYGMAKLMCGETGIYDCDYLINVPCHKALEGYSGVTLSMKNHYGTCAPNHDDIMNRIPLYNALPQIRDKTRLIVLDAIFTQYQWYNGRRQDTVDFTHKLLFSTDPVAVDYTGWQMIEALRETKGLHPVAPAPDFIRIAAEDHGLGNNDPDRIELIDLNLSQSEIPAPPTGLQVTG